MKLLKELYTTYSPSRKERTHKIVMRELDKMNIHYNKMGKAIYSINPGKPLLSAHLDQVESNKPATKAYIKKGIISGNGALGCDDKNGIWVILNALKEYPDTSFIFSDCEEVGGNMLPEILFENDSILETIPYAIVIDRKGSADIICTANDYGSIALETDLENIGASFGLKATSGVYSDADTISEYISCANISCGYYNAHTDYDYTVISELKNCLNYVLDVLKYMPHDRYDLPDKTTFSDFCNYCYMEMDIDWNYCPYCGNELHIGKYIYAVK